MADRRGPSVAAPMLAVSDLHVHYGRVPVLQGLNLRLDRGVVAVVGRNGMGKSTLCKTVTGLVRPTRGAIRAGGEDIAGLPPHRIARLGLGYVPQGRRCWPSLTVDEHLRLASRKGASGEWTLERAYDTFPRLKERRRAGGAQLSGGEQQMLAISRALIGNPRLLIMDEPTEGLAPVVVQQIEHMIRELVREGKISFCSSNNSSVWRSISRIASRSCCTAGSSARCSRRAQGRSGPAAPPARRRSSCRRSRRARGSDGT